MPEDNGKGTGTGGKSPFSVAGRLRSFRCALRGIWILLRSQPNAWIHALATVLVCAAGLCFGFTRSEWGWVIVAMVMVWAAEAANTALEFLADAVSPERHPPVGKAKDVAAGAVLIAAIGAAVIGILVIGPHVLRLFAP